MASPTVADLRIIARRLGISYANKRKHELIAAIAAAQEQDDEEEDQEEEEEEEQEEEEEEGEEEQGEEQGEEEAQEEELGPEEEGEEEQEEEDEKEEGEEEDEKEKEQQEEEEVKAAEERSRAEDEKRIKYLVDTLATPVSKVPGYRVFIDAGKNPDSVEAELVSLLRKHREMHPVLIPGNDHESLFVFLKETDVVGFILLTDESTKREARDEVRVDIVDIEPRYQGKRLCKPFLKHVLAHYLERDISHFSIMIRSRTQDGIPACLCYSRAAKEVGLAVTPPETETLCRDPRKNQTTLLFQRSKPK